ncbi:MAG: 3-isopropylmalate dehydratase [Chitinophagaceae bacterium]|jgi:3-isopropylmalate/(R)-2-methylmalate dehydratase small subunit
MSTIKGKAWVAKNYVMSFDMIIQKFWTSPIDPIENSKWVMAGVDEAFNKENGFKDCGYTFIVAGHNFAGGGKSIEHCITGLMGANIKAVFATSFARLQFRNAINYGMPFVTCRDMNIECETGDELEYNPSTGIIHNLTNGKTFQSLPQEPFVSEVAQVGGLMNFIKSKIIDGSIVDLH